MNCAVVTISGGRKSRSISAKELVTPRASDSSIFVANIGNGCTTVDGKDVAFPNPGSQVEYDGIEANRAAPLGSCGSPPAPSSPVGTGNNESTSGSGDGTGGGGGSGEKGGNGGSGESGGGGASGASGGSTGNCGRPRSQGHLCSRAAGRGEELQGAILLMVIVTLANWCII